MTDIMLNGILLAITNSLPIFVTIGLALWFKHKKMIPEGSREALRFVIFKIMIPFLVFKVLFGLKLGPDNVFLIITCVALELALIFSVFIFKKKLPLNIIDVGTINIAILAFSVGPFGYPFTQLNFSNEVFQNLVLVDIILFMILLFVGPLLGTYYDENSRFNFKEIINKVIRDPVLITMFVTFALTYLNVDVPKYIINVADYISKGFTFMAIFLVGMSLKKPNMKEIKVLFSTYIFRVLVIIVIAGIIFTAFQIPLVQRQALILAFLTPFSSFTLMYTEEYDLNSTLVSQLSIFSVSVSLIIYPVLIAILQTWK